MSADDFPLMAMMWSAPYYEIRDGLPQSTSAWAEVEAAMDYVDRATVRERTRRFPLVRQVRVDAGAAQSACSLGWPTLQWIASSSN
jgi:hypothetical protein